MCVNVPFFWLLPVFASPVKPFLPQLSSASAFTFAHHAGKLCYEALVNSLLCLLSVVCLSRRSVLVQLLKSSDLGRHSLLYLKELGQGWFGKVAHTHLLLLNAFLQCEATVFPSVSSAACFFLLFDGGLGSAGRGQRRSQHHPGGGERTQGEFQRPGSDAVHGGGATVSVSSPRSRVDPPKSVKIPFTRG